MKLTKSAQNMVLRLQIELTKSVTIHTARQDETAEVSNHTYGKATLTWFEEIFEEY
ncbi:chlorohydrolase [Streptococcus pneumoniae]|uniref:chlorohydrolase n=1 Tax=Streptococcus pneumoniae TaxID=1313 RepID=UPI000990D0B5|nr:chlorohydrolase [Streptococcus pneumoniae]